MKLRLRIPSSAAPGRAAERAAPSPLDAVLEERGSDLDPEVRAEFEARFGHDLGDIRVHTGGAADAAARRLDARALAVGAHLLFASGEYRPASLDGRRLLAHEIAHAIQGSNALQLRTAADADPGPDSEAPGDHLAKSHGPASEDEAAEFRARAAAAATTVATPRAPAPVLRGSPGRSPIHRFPASLPIRDAAVPLADPVVELVAIDIARALEADPADGLGRTRRRVARMAVGIRAAVVTRVGELLTPTQREQAAKALTGAALGEERPPATEAVGVGPADVADRAVTPDAAAAPEMAPTPDEPEHARAAQGVAAGVAEASGGEALAAAPEPTDGIAEAAEGAPSELVGAEGAAMAAAGPPGAAAVAGTGGPAAVAPENAAEAVPPDLAPFDQLESRLAERQREEEEAAREAEATSPTTAEAPAPAGVLSPGEAAARLEPPASASPAEATETAAAEAAQQSVAEPADEAPAATAGGLVAPPIPQAEPAGVEAATAGPLAPAAEGAPDAADPGAPTAEEIALAAEPAQPATPELEREMADAEGTLDPGTAIAAASEPAAPLGPSAGPPAAAAPAAGSARSPSVPAVALPADAEEPAAEPAAPTEVAETATPAEGLAEGSRSSGDCGPDAGGGGGAGAAVAEPVSPVTPDVSAAPPAEAMGAIAQLPPAEMGAALAGVGTSAAGAVAADRAQLAAQPPSFERPAGSPETRPAGAARAVAAGTEAAPAQPAPVKPIAGTGSGAVTASAPLPPAGALPTQGVVAPAVAGGPQREVTAADAQALRASVEDLPVTDQALAIDAGPAPTVALEGDADPTLASDRRNQVEDRTRVAQEQGQVDAARPLGEHDIYPTVPAQTLTAEISPPTPAAMPVAVAAPDEPTAIVAREEHTEEVRTAAASARGQMVAEREGHEQRLVEGRTAAQQQMDEEVRLNAEQQAERRREARVEVGRERGHWSAEQGGEVSRGRAEADTEHVQSTTAIATRRRAGDREAATEIEEGNAKAAAERQKAERDARAKRDSGKRESSGVLGWLADRARSFFNALKRGIQAIFNAARALVRRAIQAAISLARRAIDAARNAIVGLIRAVGDRLIAIADRVLAAFPALRDRFRAAIRRVVDVAVAAINRLADALKEGIQRALTALGSLIEGALSLLERAYTAAIDAVAGAVQSAIRAAQAVVQFLGEFAALIRDVAGGPMAWLRNLGASVVDGLRNHVWRVLKCAVKEWFNSKVEAVLGLGRAIYDALRNGGIRLAEIGRMVWDALKAALPGIAIQLAIEKLLSLLVPAASAVMLIIDGLRAAWGAISRIIAAIEAFFRFLRAVKGGNAGRLFANALAAGAIALIDFLSNFLVARLRGPAAGVGGRLSGIAARLGRVGGAVARGARRVGGAVRRVASGVARVAGRAGGAAMTGARVVGRGVRAARRGVIGAARAVQRGVVGGARVVSRGVVAGGRAVGRGMAQVALSTGRAIATAARAVGGRVAGAARTVGRRIAAGARATVVALARRFPRVAAAVRRARTAWQRARARFRQWRERRRQRRRQSAEDRLRRAVAAIRGPAEVLLRDGVSPSWMRARLLLWRVRWRLSHLGFRPDGMLEARVNPRHPVVSAEDVRIGEALDQILFRAERAFLRGVANNPRTRAVVNEAIRRVRTGDPDLPEMTRVQQIIFFRRLRRERIRPPIHSREDPVRFGSDPTATNVLSHRQLSRYWIQHAAGGSYPTLLLGVVWASRVLRVPQAAIMHAISAPTPHGMRGRLAAMTRRMGAPRRALFMTTLRPLIQMAGLLLHGLEPARSPGVLTASSLSSALGTGPRETMGRWGRQGVMTRPGSGAAADERYRRRQWGRPSPQLFGRWRRAEDWRVVRQLNVFRRLRDIVRRGQLKARSGARSRVLTRLAEAFDRWLSLQLRADADPQALERSADRLIASVKVFLRQYHGTR